MTHESHKYSLGLVGGRGYVGKELLQLLVAHPSIDVAWISSRQLEGTSSTALVPGLPDFAIETLSPEQVGQRQTDIVVLALPNGLAQPYVDALQTGHTPKLILDLSADHRDSQGWIYSVPELDKPTAQSQLKISNPGCYATAMQLGLAPVVPLLAGPAHCFGVSGYSGAGTTPSDKNDPDNLKDNLLPYGLTSHGHELEVATRLDHPIAFTPHVAEFFRGISMTIQVEFQTPQNAEALLQLFEDFYAGQALVKVGRDIPTIKQVVNTAACRIGGFALSQDGKRATLVSCLDNLLKGAASQALQNINLALGLNHTTGLGDIL